MKIFVIDQRVFNVYIDEAGDEGFTRKNGIWVSSQWFVMGAFIVRSTNDLTVSRSINVIKETLGIKPTKPLHFTDLSHERKKFVIKTITDVGLFRCTYVAVKKEALDENTPLKKRPLLYNYCTRYLLERITWLVGDEKGKANLIFENRSNTSYDELKSYIHMVTNMPGNKIRQNVIQSFKPLAKAQSKNLQIADAITSSLFQALEITKLGLHEPSYIEKLKPFIYKRNGNYSSYGLKFFPDPITSAQLIEQYPWLTNFSQNVVYN